MVESSVRGSLLVTDPLIHTLKNRVIGRSMVARYHYIEITQYRPVVDLESY